MANSCLIPWRAPPAASGVGGYYIIFIYTYIYTYISIYNLNLDLNVNLSFHLILFNPMDPSESISKIE